jgi:sortase (surface protein transpeptidase)
MKGHIVRIVGGGVLLCVLTLLLHNVFVAIPNEQVYHAEPEIVRAEDDVLLPDVPMRLRIPKIGVDAFVQSVGFSPLRDGEMGVPTNFTDVGWYKEGVRPGEKGSAVIDGHFNGKNVPKGVFYDLHTVAVGDSIFVDDAASTTHEFRVTRVRSYDHDAPTEDVFVGDSAGVYLNLITCAGEWIPEKKLYDTRTVVFTQSVSE